METGNLKERQEKEGQAVRLVRRRLIQKKQPRINDKAVSAVRMGVLFITLAALAGMIITAFSISCSRILVYGLLFFYSVMFTWYYDKEKSKPIFQHEVLWTFLGTALLAAVTGNLLKGSFYSVMNDMIYRINLTYQGSLDSFPKSETTGTYFLALIFFWIGIFLSKGMLERQDNYHFIFVAFPLTVLSFLGGGTPSKVSLGVLLLSLLTVTSSAGVSMRKKFWCVEESKEFNKNKRVSRRIQFRLALLSAFVGTMLMFAAFFALKPVLTLPVEKISQAASPVKTSSLQFLYEILPKISGGKLSFSMEGVGGGVSHGTLGEVSGFAYDNTEALQLTCSRKPQETVYLKGFIGTEYIRNRWKERDGTEFENAVKNWEVQENPLIFIQNLPFLRMLYAQKMLGEDDGSRLNSPIEMSVKRLDANIEYTYVPYQTFLSDFYQMSGGDGAVVGQDMQEDVYSWFPVKEYQSVITRWKAEQASQGLLEDYEEVYSSYVEEQDTLVDETGLEGILELCREKREEWDSKVTEEMTQEQLEVIEKEKYEDVKQFIIRTLWSNCTFTTEVWKLPKGEDFVNYFFFEKKRGDSTAFATTAALMYRMCGIPARYVVGYAAPSSLFIGNGDGTYTAVLQNDNAHAWVEIYMPEFGWTPVETTPGFVGTVVDMEVSEEDLKEQEKVKEEQKEEDEQKKNAQNSWQQTAFWGKVLMIVLVFGIVLLTLTVRYRYLYKKRRGMLFGLSEEEQVKRIFYSFYDVLHFTGFSPEIDTTTPEFVKEVNRIYPEISMENLVKYMNLVLQVHYGYQVISKEDTEFSKFMYEMLVKQVAVGLSKKKRLIFHYWKAF